MREQSGGAAAHLLAERQGRTSAPAELLALFSRAPACPAAYLAYLPVPPAGHAPFFFGFSKETFWTVLHSLHCHMKPGECSGHTWQVSRHPGTMV